MSDLLKAFNNYVNDEYEDYIPYFDIFAIDFTFIIQYDPNFESFLEENELLKEQWNEIKDNVLYDIEYALKTPSIETEFENHHDLALWLIYTASHLIKSALFSPTIEEKIYIDFYQSEETFRDREEVDIADSRILEQFDVVHSLQRSFSLNMEYLLTELKNWKPHDFISSSIKTTKITTLIKPVDSFDMTVYELIKNDPSLLKTMDWRIFEEMIADILKTFGYEIELTKKTKDGGVDVIAIKHNTEFGNHKYILQAKRSINAIQVTPIRELMFLHSEQKASKSCLATTSSFTSGAKKLGEQFKWTLDLKDRDGILAWIDRTIDIKKSLNKYP